MLYLAPRQQADSNCGRSHDHDKPHADTVDNLPCYRKQEYRSKGAREGRNCEGASCPAHVLRQRFDENGKCVKDHSPAEEQGDEGRANNIVAVEPL